MRENKKGFYRNESNGFGMKNRSDLVTCILNKKLNYM